MAYCGARGHRSCGGARIDVRDQFKPRGFDFAGSGSAQARELIANAFKR
jgi:hypothetical protein